MSTYTTSYASALAMNSDNTFTVLATSEAHSVATDSTADGVFQAGEAVSIDTEMNSSQIQATIEGFFEDGYVIFADGGYVLFTNTEYAADHIFALETEETGYPGLPVCFTKGTLLDTAEGAIAIENLQAGDKVLCSTGLKQVKWIGWRACKVNSPRLTHEQRINSAPVRIKQGALGNALPTSDLVVSPWHHLYLDGVLVRANRLLNGVTIVQDLHVAQAEYFHVELEQFDVVRAYGVYSESWADGGNRDFFENAPVTAIHAQPQQRMRAARPGFVVQDDKAAIRALNQRLQSVAALVEPEPEQKIA